MVSQFEAGQDFDSAKTDVDPVGCRREQNLLEKLDQILEKDGHRKGFETGFGACFKLLHLVKRRLY